MVDAKDISEVPTIIYAVDEAPRKAAFDEANTDRQRTTWEKCIRSTA